MHWLTQLNKKGLHSITYISLDLFTETVRAMLQPSLMFQLPRTMFQVTVIAYIILLLGALHSEFVTVACRIIAALSILGVTFGRHGAFPEIPRSPPLVLGAYPLVHSVLVLVLFVTFSWLTFVSHSINLINVFTFPSGFVSV